MTFSFLGWVMGFEPTNTGTTIRGLRPLGDTHHVIRFADQKNGTQVQSLKWHARRDSLINERLRLAVAGIAHPRCN